MSARVQLSESERAALASVLSDDFVNVRSGEVRAILDGLFECGTVERVTAYRITPAGRWALLKGTRAPMPWLGSIAIAGGIMAGLTVTLLALFAPGWPTWAGVVGSLMAIRYAFQAGRTVKG